MAKKKTKSKGKARKSREPVIVPEKVLGSFSGREDTLEMLELGQARQPVSLQFRNPAECIAAGRIVKKAPPGSMLPFVCARKPGLGGVCGTDGAGGMGVFSSTFKNCPPGLVRVETRHPRWGTPGFIQCVKPGTTARLRLRGGMGELFPTEISFPAVILGNLIGLGVATTTPRLMTALNVKPLVVNIVKIALGASGAGLFFVSKKSMPLGIALGTVPGAVGAIADFVVGIITPKEKAALKGLEQLEPEDVREIKEVEEVLTAALAQRERTVEETTEEELGQVSEEPAEDPTTALPFRTVV